jgi:CHAD domain-containing protein
MLKLLESASALLDGVRQGKDTECIHRMRVACRRLRYAMTVFDDCFDKSRYRLWARAVHKITRRLGLARDLDVQLLILDKLRHALPNRAYRPGVRRVQLRATQRRNRVQNNVIEAADKFSRSYILIEMAFYLRRLKSRNKARNNEKNVVSKLQRKAGYLVMKHLENITAIEENVFDVDRFDDLHQLRIDVRSVRYAAEIFAACYPSRLENEIQVLRELQDMLGDIHDNITLINYLSKFTGKEGLRILDYYGRISPLRNFKPGITFLIRNRQKYCAQQLSRLAEYWTALKNKSAWENMASTFPPALKPQRAAAIRRKLNNKSRTLSG